MAQSLSARSIGKIADTKAVPDSLLDKARGRKVHQWFPCIWEVYECSERRAHEWARVKFVPPLKCADALRGVLSSDGRGRGDGAGGDCAMGNGSGYVCTWIRGFVIC